VVALALLWYAFRDVSIVEMLGRLGEVKFGWIYLSVLLSLISHVLRAYRWSILLKPLDYHINIFRSFWAVMVGYLANLAFPRMGEVTKCGVLKKTDGVKISVSMGTVVTERIFDVLSLLLIIVVTFLIEFGRLNEFFLDLFNSKISSDKIPPIELIVAMLVGLITIGIVLFILRKKIRSTEVYLKFISVFGHFKNGLFSIRKIDNIPGFILSTMGIWVLYYLMSYTILFSIPETSELDWIAGLAILIVGGIAMSAPVQGGIGTYHFLVAGLLTLYGIDQANGLFYATLLHTSQTLSVMIFGGLGLIVVSFTKKKWRSSDMTLSPEIFHWRESGKRIVFTNGCFDIIHAGHIQFLSEAKSLGDKLIVGLNSDHSVKILKGDERPVNPLVDRANILESIRFVDLVIPFEEETPILLIEALSPDVLVKGGDYAIGNIIGSNFVLASGGVVKTISFVEGYSTSEILKRIKGS